MRDGRKAPRAPTVVKTSTGAQTLHEASLARSGPRLAGPKGYVTNIPAQVIPASEVIGSCHEAVGTVQESFRMSKIDLPAQTWTKPVTSPPRS